MSSEFREAEFSRWRAFFWPVHAYELKKLFPMLLIFFLISFDYNILRTMKDALVVTAKASGAEVIPFIKVWVMFPGAVLMTFLFTRLSNRFLQETVFYVMVSLFLLYFFVFTFALYPVRDSIHPHAFADYLQSVLPSGCKGMVAMLRYWTFTSFYAMSELWGNIILFLLFWGFANRVTLLHEAKRFYGLFGIGANFSGIAAGQVSVLFCRHMYNANLPFGEDAWEQTMIMLVSLVIIVGLVTMGIFRWMHTTVLTSPRYGNIAEENNEKRERGTLSLRENFAYLIKSRYLLYLALIVISYNVVINLVEVVWKHQVRELYPNPKDYNLYMNQVTTIIGISATLTALFISGNSIRKFGWTFTALLAPAILLVTSIAFFGFFFSKAILGEQITSFLDIAPLAIIVFFGSAQNCLSRAAKYTVFDATKEMAFVPLSSEAKIKGKAAIDGVCSRLGKSGGSVIHQVLLIAFSTITASAPYVAAILLVVISGWITATYSLGKKFSEVASQSLPHATPHPERETAGLTIEEKALNESQAAV